MMDFDTAVTLLISPLVEGGYSNNRLDPGGETMWGITRRVAQLHGYMGDMHVFPKDSAIAIYKSDYWDPQHTDDLPDPLRYPLFDGSVNEGVERIAGFLHECLGLDYGPIDAATVVAAGLADPWELTCALLAKRARHYTSLPTFGGYGRGWTNRLATNLEIISTLKGTPS